MPNIDSIKELLYFPMSVEEALLELKRFEASIPIVFLDEFFVSDCVFYNAFLMNVFRSLGVVCVTMGTEFVESNSFHSIQLDSDSSVSTRHENDWSYLRHRLPPPTSVFSDYVKNTLNTLKEHKHFADLVSWIETVPCSNPRMFNHFFGTVGRTVSEHKHRLDKCSVSSFLHQVVDESSQYFRKDMCFENEEIPVGQVAINFKTWRDPEVSDLKIQNARASFLIQSITRIFTLPSKSLISP